MRHARPFPHAVLAALIIGLVGVCAYVFHPHSVSGDEFKAAFDRDAGNSASTWELYSESSVEYCFKYSPGIPPATRYCVPKTDLLVIGPGEVPRYMKDGDFVLLESRRPGAKRIAF